MKSFHAITAIVACALTIAIGIGFKVESITIPGAIPGLLSFLLLLALALPIPLVLRSMGKPYFLDALLTLSWALFFTVALHDLVFIAARIGSAFPYCDTSLAHVDARFGLSTLGLNRWASHSWLGSPINRSYELLQPFMEAAVLLPILLGKIAYAKRFILGNLVAFAIAIPVFILWPAIGPWTVLPLPSSSAYLTCERELNLLRHAGVFTPGTGLGVMCFPSFHVIWPILCSRSLFVFRWLRIPAILLSISIALSTMTTGWHYGCDVTAGIVIAFTSIILVERIVAQMPTIRSEFQPKRLTADDGVAVIG
ncbi:MAG: phosphatase PAP2 family protein [Terracidiphilus sp.]